MTGVGFGHYITEVKKTKDNKNVKLTDQTREYDEGIYFNHTSMIKYVSEL